MPTDCGSRICVKNLPKYVGEDRLRELFSQKGEVTDTKVMRTRDGKSRQFAFVGFRSEDEAREALRFFNKSYLDTCRITCEIAHKVGDPNIPRPWSKHSIQKSSVQKGKSVDNVDSEAEPSTSKSLLNGSITSKLVLKGNAKNDDPQLQEFLAIMQPRSKSKIWANDTVGASSMTPNNAYDGKGLLLNDESHTDIQTHTQSDGKITNRQTKVSGTNDSGGSPITLSLDVIPDEDISDMDYFRSRVKKNWSDVESDGDDHDSVYEDNKKVVNTELMVQIEQHGAHGVEHTHNVETTLKHSEEGRVHKEITSPSHNNESEQVDNGRLFIRNLPYTTNENELRDLFSKFGEVDDVHLVIDKDTKQSKGIAYVHYQLPESAARALEEVDNSIFQGRLLHVLLAKPQNQLSGSDLNTSSGKDIKNFKQKREEQKKASEVSGDTKSWNSLFMRADTVVENVARKYGISKSDLLDRDADDLAVRLALGETHVIAETKKALSNAGINVLALEKYASKHMTNMGRSKEVILVKNLPFHSSEEDLTTMFGKFGSLDKVILPPTKALAVVVFLEPAEARAAFKGLAYKRYKDAPLYLEWAPDDILSPRITSEAGEQNNIVDEQQIKRVIAETVDGVSEADLDPDRAESRSLFVKNLNFKTSDEALKKHFNDNIKKGHIHSVKIKKHVKNGKNVSMGYGFVEFDSLETATNICRDLQGTILDGHALILQLCHARKDANNTRKVDKDKSSTKLIVRNVAFEATEKDLRQLFSPFGQIKSVRLPMKFGSHRGFAFVEYITKQEAQNAMQALSNTHLYGRHLVIEPAKEGESLEELRARTASQFLDGTDGVHKLSKKRKLIAVADEAKHKFEQIMG